ncbi:SGNH/GDSL hydrolase family protein [Methylopila musalis]|uniref:SGNH/GDSL hydrolase family protein n=1 Tax=Methylopila musalis TaxID=1134781 RepID=A0ABW3Z4U8_9HYPH
MTLATLLRRVALGALIAAAPLSARAAEPFSQLVAFSGALTDTGNFASEKGDYPAPFYNNRNANGPLAIDVLAKRLGLKADASLHLAGKQGGTNFAVSDALAGGAGAHDLPKQVDAYLARNDGKADPKALHFLFIGGNDVVLAVQTMDDRAAEKILDDAVTGIETAMGRLQDAGAKTIFAPDFIDIGHAPIVKKFGPEATKRATRLSALYNQKFDVMLDRVQKDAKFELVRWRFGDFVNGLIAHGPEFGLTNVDGVCLDDKAACDPEKYVFLTGEYPTAKVHELVGSAMAIAVLERGQRPPASSARPID